MLLTTSMWRETFPVLRTLYGQESDGQEVCLGANTATRAPITAIDAWEPTMVIDTWAAIRAIAILYVFARLK